MDSELDMLVESGLLQIILETIKEDYLRLCELFNVRLDDIFRDNNSIESLVSNGLTMLSEKCDELGTKMNENIKDFDVEKFNQVVKTLSK